MPTLHFSDDAILDLEPISQYIARDKPQAARMWVQKIRAKCRMLRKHPNIGDRLSGQDETFRTTYVGRYVIIFRRTADLVEIVRVVSGDQE